MMTLGRWARVAAVLALVALVGGGALMASHPEVHSTATDQDFPWLAAWDIALNDAYNDPDGFPRIAGERIGDRCVDAGQRRFRAGSICAGLGVAGLAVASVLEARGRRRERNPMSADSSRQIRTGGP